MAKSSKAQKKKESLPDEKTTECPMCSTNVPDGMDECPKCGEPFTPEALNAGLEKGSKFLFRSGIILVLIGGCVALGSWLRNILEISIAGNSNFEFGRTDRLIATIGIIILVVGIILLILSLPKERKIEPEDEEISDIDETEDQGG